MARDWASLVGGTEGLIVESVAPHVLRLGERVVAPAERSWFYLVSGRERDCLIDGGWGFCDNLGALRPDPAKPLVAIATHTHMDHVGLLHCAEQVHVHPSELDILRHLDPFETQALPYLDGRPVLEGGGSIAPDTIRQTPVPSPIPIGEGDCLDLGGVRLDVIHTPGHSPGSLSILDTAAGLLFCADTVHDGHIWDDIPGADPAALLLSHERLARVEFAQACPGHGALLSPSQFAARMDVYRRGGTP